nr:chromatin modification-related protein EAF7-like [Ipomoea trifida]GLL42543.1 chromatin modification-related protein EAF7-like [Ipomoea trifida]
MFSRFQARFVDHNPEVGTSNTTNQAEGSGDNTTRVDANANAQTKDVETTLVAEAKSSGDQTEPSNDQPENTLAEDATPDADDSTESSSSNDSGVVESTPLAREDEELSRQVEVNDTPSSPTPNVEIPRNDLQIVVDPSLKAEINLGSSLSSTRGENRDAPLGASHGDFEPSTTDQTRMSPSNPRQMSDTTLILYALQIMAKDSQTHFKTIRKAIHRTKKVADETKACVTKDSSSAKPFVDTQPSSTSHSAKFEEVMLKALTNTDTIMDYLMEGMTNLHSGQEKIQKEQHSMKHNYFGLKEMVDLSCLKLDFVNENVTIAKENQLHALWEITEHGKSAKKSAPKQMMTKTADRQLVPYVEGSGERFGGNTIPPTLMNQDNQARIFNGQRTRKVKEKMVTMEIIRKSEEDHIKFNAVFQIIGENKQSYYTLNG